VSSDEKTEFPPTNQSRVDGPAEGYTKMLRRRVNREGDVHYAGIHSDPRALDDYLGYLSKRYELISDAPRNAAMAYWINVYNAAVIKLVVVHYPIHSILDIGYGDNALGKPDYSMLYLQHTNHPFDKPIIKLGKSSYSLNTVRDSILMGNYHDPRVHFALVYGSISSPRLRRELYTEGNIDAVLDQATSEFISTAHKNNLNPNTPTLAAIFERYKNEFGESPEALINFINVHIPVRILPNAQLGYMEEDWALNGY
jgi:hypothetical protein